VKTPDIVIIGSGSLASGVVNALSHVSMGALRIAIIARSRKKVSQMALIANARAASLGTSIGFLSVGIPEFKALSFSRAFRSLKPKVILHAASLQSPWEAAQGQNAWTKLIAAGGFGITLPLQLALAAEISRGAADTEAAIVNACYPDCVNLVLHRLGLRTTCGVGNAAIVEAFCRSHAKTASRDVRVVGHHGHLGVWLKGRSSRSQPRVWVKNREVDSLRFRPRLGSIGEELNTVTSATAISVMMSLLTGATLRASIPGVAGLPGGYPFVLKRRKFTLRLPSGITSAEAIAHNKSGERLDGLDLESGAKFVGDARRSLASVCFEYAQGFDLAEWPNVCRRMLALRNRLRGRP
jgi:hypothetical protein